MTRDGDHGVRKLFAAGSRDLTPVPASHAARLLFSPVSGDPVVSGSCAAVLSPTERRRAGRFAADEDRVLFEQRRAFRRFCAATARGSLQALSEIVFAETENGQPYLEETPDLRFSFSSCRSGLVGAWSSTHGIGVDIEDRAKEPEAADLAREFFSIGEAEAVSRAVGEERLRTFARFWSLKEAALKSIGEGLPFGLDAFEFELHPTPRVVRSPPDSGGPSRFESFVIEGTHPRVALVLRRLT